LQGLAFLFSFQWCFFGNELFRSYALLKFHRIPLPRAIVSVAIERFLDATAYLLFWGVGIGFLLASKNVLISSFFWWVLFGAGVLVMALVLFYFKSHRKESIVRMFFPSIAGTNGVFKMEQELLYFFRLRNRAFWEGLFLSFAKVSFTLLRTIVLIALLGEFIGFFPAIAITGFSFLSLLIPIPGQLGAHEALQILVFQSLGLASHTGAAFAFVVRAVEIVVAVGGLILFLHSGASLLKRVVLSKIEHVFQKFF